MSNRIQITTNDARDAITARLDRHYTARLDRDDTSAAEHIREQVRSFADGHGLTEDETVGAEVIGDDGTTLLYTTDVTAWH